MKIRTFSLVFILGIAFAITPAFAQQRASTFWEALNDTTLNRLMNEALRGNRELQAADARSDGASAARLQAALDLVPAVTANAGYTRRRLASTTFPGAAPGVSSLPDQDIWDSGLNASWEVDVFGRLRRGLSARNALLDAAHEDVRAAQVSLAGAVARSYLDLRGAQGQMGVARRNSENQRRTLELTQHRLDAGRGTAFDTERARAQLAATLAAIPLLEARIAAMQHRVAVLVGRSPHELAAEFAAERELPELPDTVPIPDAADVLRTRPDVLSAERQMAAGKALVSSARADFLPRVNLGADAGYTANQLDTFGQSGTFSYTVGPVISWAAFDLGRVKARVDAAQAQEREATMRYQQMVLVVQEQLATARVRYHTSRARLRNLIEAADASERAATLARQRFEGGVTDFLQVLDAERTMLAAQDQLAQARTDAANAYVTLYEALGAAWPHASQRRN